MFFQVTLFFLKERKDSEKMSIFKCPVLGYLKWPHFSFNPLDSKFDPGGRTRVLALFLVGS